MGEGMTPEGKRKFHSDLRLAISLVVGALIGFGWGINLANRGPVEVTHKVQCTMEAK